MANFINPQQLGSKQVPLGLRHIFPIHDVREVPSAVFVGDILLRKPNEFTWGETLCRHGAFSRNTYVATIKRGIEQS